MHSRQGGQESPRENSHCHPTHSTEDRGREDSAVAAYLHEQARSPYSLPWVWKSTLDLKSYG